MKNLELLYEDEHLCMVNKPAGLLSIADRFDTAKPNLFDTLKNRLADVYVVHRLDRETSGIICFAKTPAAHRHLSLQFEKRTAQKIYLALVDGRPELESAKVEVPIGPHPTLSGKMTVIRTGKPATTLYKEVETFKIFTLVQAKPLTGRMHQIRVHMAYAGHPLSVDALYGQRNQLFLSEIKTKAFKLGKFEEEQPVMTRTTLHASSLELMHPATGERLLCEAPLHKDFRALLSQLRKWGI